MTSTLQRGDLVKPNAEAVRLTQYKDSSRLVVRENNGGGERSCSACLQAKVKEWHDRGSTWMGEFEAFKRVGFAAKGPGDLYAAGKESGCPLCLDHVELVEA